MHRNTYLNSPELLDETYKLKSNINEDLKSIYFAGQITGVEGYVESISSGLVAGINVANEINKREKSIFPNETVIGSLAKYISSEHIDFEPMNANFGILPELEQHIKEKQERYKKQAGRSIEKIKQIKL